jgi:hypothetical protein
MNEVPRKKIQFLVHNITVTFTGIPHNTVNCKITLAILKEADVTSYRCETETAGITSFRNLWLENHTNLNRG